MTRRLLVVIGWTVSVLIAVGSIYLFIALTSSQAPRTYWDTEAYFQIARRGWSTAMWFSSKPPALPALFGSLDCDPTRIASVQRALCLVCWLAFGAALTLSVRTHLLRCLALLLTASLLLEPTRMGWTSGALSESVDDSLMALLLALCMLVNVSSRLQSLTRRRQALGALGGALAAVGVVFVFCRDTNALIALVAVACAAVLWRRKLVRWRRSYGWIFVLLVISAASITDLASAQVVGSPLPFQDGWDTELTARAAYPLVNNILVRVLPDPEARAYFEDRGLEMQELEPYASPPHIEAYLASHQPGSTSHHWIASHGSLTFLTFLIRHPLQRIGELAADGWTVLAPDLHAYMPDGWSRRAFGHPVLAWFRGLTASRGAIIVIGILALSLGLLRLRTDPMRQLGYCIVISGIVGGVASYYGDAIELPRHCYGAGQQVVTGAWLIFVASADYWLCRWRTRWAAPSA